MKNQRGCRRIASYGVTIDGADYVNFGRLCALSLAMR
jgi:hypothetical protein